MISQARILNEANVQLQLGDMIEMAIKNAKEL